MEPDPEGFVQLNPALTSKRCPSCWDAKVEDCALCEGTGEWTLYVAPRVHTVQRFCEVIYIASSVTAFGAWPSPGGMTEQSNWMVEATRFVARLKAFSEDEKRQQMEAAAKRRGRR